MTVNQAITLMIRHTNNVDTNSMIEIYEPRIYNCKNPYTHKKLIADFSVWLYGVDYPGVKKEHDKAHKYDDLQVSDWKICIDYDKKNVILTVQLAERFTKPRSPKKL